MKKLFFGLFTVLLASCSAKVTTSLQKSFSALNKNEEVFVIGITDDIPASAIELGSIKIGDNGFSTNCGWEAVIEKAKNEARKAGGNVLKITEHTLPSLSSTCDQIRAKILRVENINDLTNIKSKTNKNIDSSWSFAKLYVYRPSGPGFLIGYNVFLGDDIIWRAKNNGRKEIKITKKGVYNLWAKTESKSEVQMNFEYGREYYLRCTMGIGVMVGRPILQFVDPSIGKSEFKKTKDK